MFQRSNRCKKRNVGVAAVLSIILLLAMTVDVSAQYKVRKPGAAKTPASIQITNPTGGATWEKGKRYDITWTSSNVQGGLKISLIDSKSKSYIITGYAANNGTYKYTVSSSLPDGAYTLEIAASSGSVTARSSGTLTVQAGTSHSKPEVTSTYTPRVPTTTVPIAPSTATTTILPGQTEETPMITTEEHEIVTPVRDDVSGFVYPDFEATEIAWVENQQVLVIRVKNNGIAYNGMLEVRVIALEGGQAFTFDRTFNWDVEFQPLESQTFSVSGFSWPDPLNYPELRIGCNLDPNNLISELNETNNGYDERVYISCGIFIDTAYSNCTLPDYLQEGMELTNYSPGMWVYDGSPLIITGLFGEQQEKVVIMRKGSTVIRPKVNSWSEERIVIGIPYKQEPGTYNLTIYCTDPDHGYTYASDTIQIKVEVTPRKNAGRKAATVSEDKFNEWTKDVDQCPVPEIQTQRVVTRDNNQGVEVHSVFICSCVDRIFHEIFQGTRLVKTGQSYGQQHSNEQDSYYAFLSLASGQYTYRCRVIATDGDADTATISFEY